jgi:hypothetical protein
MDPRRPSDDSPEPRPHDAARGDDLQAVAHRLREAATLVVGRAQLASRHLRTADDVQPSRLLADLAAIERAAKRIVDAAARLEAEDGPPVDDRGAARRPAPSPAASADDDDRDGAGRA